MSPFKNDIGYIKHFVTIKKPHKESFIRPHAKTTLGVSYRRFSYRPGPLSALSLAQLMPHPSFQPAACSKAKSAVQRDKERQEWMVQLDSEKQKISDTIYRYAASTSDGHRSSLAYSVVGGVKALFISAMRCGLIWPLNSKCLLLYLPTLAGEVATSYVDVVLDGEGGLSSETMRDCVSAFLEMAGGVVMISEEDDIYHDSLTLLHPIAG